MFLLLALCLLLAVTSGAVSKDTESSDTRTFIELYDEGVQAYLENNYGACVTTLENAINHYRSYYDQVTQCRVECGYKMRRERPFFPFNHENLQFFDNTVKRTLCLVQCYDTIYVDKVKYPRHLEIKPFYRHAFRFRKAYEYLQLCYYREDEIVKAASATYTVLVRNPEDKMMLKNFEYYLAKLGSVSDVDVEEPRFASFYHRGIELYEKKDYDRAIEQLELSLNEYIHEENKCRAFCEGDFDQGWNPDMYSAVSNHFVFSLHCKRNCTEDFRLMRGKVYDDIFPTHFEYLHYSYFKSNQLDQAIKCALSFLLFYPDDELMLDNLKLYMSYQHEKTAVIEEPRVEAKEYLERLEYEKQILAYVFEKFGGKIHPELPKRFDDETMENLVLPSNTVEQPSPPPMASTTAPKELRALHGQNRHVVDGFISEAECSEILQLLKGSAIVGDGYDGDPNPHTPHETLIGMRLSRAALLTYFNLIESLQFKLLLTTTERMRREAELQFQIKDFGKLYFTYTHLVCRQANPGSQPDRFSHDIHADNCNLRANGTCDKAPPAFTWRDVSALLYLNDQDHDFVGGDFMFTADANGNVVEDLIHPKCGRLLTFTSDERNKHGVMPVTRGERCALAIWFTFDPSHKELDHEMGQKVMRKIESEKGQQT